MMRRVWFAVSAALSGGGLLLAALTQQAVAQWGIPSRALFRGAIAHSVTNKGMSGARDNGQKQEPHGFSYPQGRSLLVYSGGAERVGWNVRRHTAGEGVWVMSKTGGAVKIAYAGTNMEPADLVSLSHDPATYPEAYLGAAHHHDWALSLRNSAGGEAAWLESVNVVDKTTTYWPAKGSLAGLKPATNNPAMIWNYHWNVYNDGRAFADRVAAGEFSKLSEPAWASSLSEDDFPDQIAISKTKSALHNLQWTRRYFQFGHTDYDDMTIVETVVENVGTTAQEEVYLAIKNHLYNTFSYGWSSYRTSSFNALSGDRLEADDYVRSTAASNYLEGGAPLGTVKPAGSALGKALADAGHPLLYVHDGEQMNARYAHPDWGDPFIKKIAWTRYVTDQQWINEGMLQQPDYFGVGVVDAMPPFNTYGGLDGDVYVMPHDNPATPLDESAKQPASIAMYRFHTYAEYDQPDPSKDSDEAVYDALTTAGHMDEPGINDTWTEFLTFGPYNLNAGEKFKVVVAYVGGMASQNAKYSDYKKFARPFEFGYMNLYNGKGAALADYAVRQQEIPLGEEAMLRNFERAIQAYDWGYDLPNQPPNIRGSKDSNLLGQTVISWSSFGEDSADPDYIGAEARDIVGYRIYRSKTENQGPFELMTEFTIANAKAGALPANVTYDAAGVFHTVRTTAFPQGIPLRTNPLVSGDDATAGGAEIPGLYTFTDTDSKAGFPNWYFIRSYDSGHSDWNGRGAVPSLESAPGVGGAAQLGATGGVAPLVPSADVFNRLEEKVGVVPNPFKIDEPTHSYKGQQKIRFINLPSRCQIEIYDVTGQKVWTQFLDDQTTGELTWSQFTEGRPSDFGQAVFPGIYFFKVTSLMPQSLWKTQSGTILVIK